MALTIRVGIAISLTGKYSSQGAQSLQGLSLWVEDVNRDGGIWVSQLSSKLPIELFCYDDGSKKQICLRLIEKLIAEDKIDILIGPYSSWLTEAACPIAERHKKVLWNHGGSCDRIFLQGFKYVVGLATPASKYFIGFLEMVHQSAPDAKQAIIFGKDTAFSNTVANGAKSYAERKGFEVRLANYPARPSDKEKLSQLLDELAKESPQVILGAGSMEDDIALAKELRRRRIGARFICLVAAPMREFRDALLEDAEGFFGPSQWEAEVKYDIDLKPTSEEFSKNFKAAYGVKPDYPAAQGYAIGLVVQRCIEEAGTLDNDRLRETAGRLKLTTFYGDFKIDPSTGVQVAHSMVLVRWQGGKKTIVRDAH